MSPSNSEFIWAGRNHMGDEPGIYGDAQYVGLSFEYPLTVKSMTTPATGKATVTVTAKDVQVFKPYPGHQITIYGYTPLTPGDPVSKWKKTPIPGATALVTADGDVNITFNFVIPAGTSANYISVGIEIDNTVKPGLYDDFLITDISFSSPAFLFFASLGFND
jgi:hypothetical protein